MKTGRLQPVEAAGLACLGLFGLGCLCALVGLTVLGSAGEIVTAPLRWFFSGPPDVRTLRQVLAERETVDFRLGPDCEFLHARGSRVDSREAGGSPGGDLPAAQVITGVQAALGDVTFQARDGSLELASGEPVFTEPVNDRSVSLAFEAQEPGPDGHTTRSLQGVVEGNVFRGRFDLNRDLSLVEGGVGVEEALSLTADLTCPVNWFSNP